MAEPGPWDEFASGGSTAVADAPPWEDFGGAAPPWQDFNPVVPEPKRSWLAEQVNPDGSRSPAVARDPNAPDANDPQPPEFGPFFFENKINIPRLEHQPGDSVTVRAAKAVTNVAGEFVSGMSSPAMITMGLPMLAAAAPGMVEATIKRVEEADKTPPYSQERMEAAATVVALFGGGAKGLKEGMKPRVVPKPAVEVPAVEKVLEPGAVREVQPVEAAPAIAVQSEGKTPNAEPIRQAQGGLTPNVEVSQSEPGPVTIETGGIPIEALAPEAPLRTADATTTTFRADESIPFLTKVRIEDQLKAQGFDEPTIAGLTTDQAAELIRRAEAGGQKADISSTPSTSEIAAEASATNSIPRPATAPEIRPVLPVETAPRDLSRPQRSAAEIKAEEEYRQRLLDEARAGQQAHGAELKDAIIRAGGLPARKSPHRTAEITDLEQTILNPERSERIPPNQIFRNNAPPLDELATRLRDQGFDVQTPGDLYNLLDDRFRTGKPIYGIPERARIFASGSRTPQLRSREKGTADLFQGADQPFNLIGEKGIDYAAREAAGKAETQRANEAAKVQDEEQARLFASGAAAPKGPRTLKNLADLPSDIVQPRSEQGKVFAAGAAKPVPAATTAGTATTVGGHRPPLQGGAPAVPTAAPAIMAAVAPLRSWWQQRTLGIRKVVAPQTIDAPARMVANIVRDYNGQLANKIAQADVAMAKARADFDRTPVPSSWKYDPAQPLPRNYAFMAESEKGGASLSTADRALKTQMDKMFEEAVDEVHRVKPAALKSLIQDYFPHIWKDPKAAQQAFASIIGTRPLEGSKTFLKKRSLAYIEDGLKMGLKPISDNPIDMVLTKLHEVHKFVAAQDMFTEAKAIGARKFVYIFEKPAEGWVKVDDPTSAVHGPPFVTVPEAFDEQMKVKTLELLDSLGIPHERVAKLGGKRWGTYETGASRTGTGGIRTKFAGPLSVYWHELGHGLEERYGWLSEILRGEKPGGFSHAAKELRALADLRAEGQPPNKSFKSYIRSADEKSAVMLEAYMHAPRRMQDVAPVIYGRVKKFIAAHPELRPIEEIRPSLVLGRGKTQIDVGGMVTLGNYYMPEGAATVFNNYLSPGLQRFGIIRNIRTSTNILSGMQLGFSAFHAGFTSIDAAVSQFALAIRYASEGRIGKAIEKTLTAPVAPVTNYMTGRKVQRAMLEPGTGSAQIQQVAELAVKAGLRATVDPFWRTQITRNMMRAWNEGGVKGYAGTILRVPFAISEQMMRPILEYLVPRQKLGVFAGMAQQHMERLGPNADVHAVRDAMARAADSTEDRMGQMTYDNLFYNRIIRDSALLGFRAYGWTFGKYRALFGGLADTLGIVSRLKADGPVITDRMAYLIALPMVAGAIGSVMNYAMTGQAPQDWKDALMPRTGRLDRNGNPQRLSLPTYIKDILSDWHDFPNTKKMLVSLSHKLNPWLSVGTDIINNADFFGTKIYNETDPFWQQQVDKLKYVAKSFQPFAVTGMLRLEESNPPLMQQVLPFFGFVPAKAALTLTPAQSLAAELMGNMLPRGARTQEAAEHSKMVAELIRDMKEVDPAWKPGIGLEVFGKLSPRDYSTIMARLPLNPLQFQVKKLSADDAMKVWDLASDQEKTQLLPILFPKIASPQNNLKPETRAHYLQVLRPK